MFVCLHTQRHTNTLPYTSLVHVHRGIRNAIGSNDVPADIVDGGVARAVCELADQIVSGEVDGGFIVACGCLTVC